MTQTIANNKCPRQPKRETNLLRKLTDLRKSKLAIKIKQTHFSKKCVKEKLNPNQSKKHQTYRKTKENRKSKMTMSKTLF